MNMVEKLPRYQQAYIRLLEGIASGAYTNGWLPPERELAASLGMRLGPVKRAEKMLQKEGLIEMQQGVGTRILDVKGSVRSAGRVPATDLVRGRPEAERVVTPIRLVEQLANMSGTEELEFILAAVPNISMPEAARVKSIAHFRRAEQEFQIAVVLGQLAEFVDDEFKESFRDRAERYSKKGDDNIERARTLHRLSFPDPK